MARNGNGLRRRPRPTRTRTRSRSSDPIAYWRLSDPLGSSVAADEMGAHPGAVVGTVNFGHDPRPESQRPERHVRAVRRDRLRRGRPRRRRLRDAAVHRRGAGVPGQRRRAAPSSSATCLRPSLAAVGWELAIVLPSPGDDPEIDGFFAPVVSDRLRPVRRSSSGAVRPREALHRLAPGDHVRRHGVHVLLGWREGRLGLPGRTPRTCKIRIQIGADFKGAIQEVAVYGKALTAEQIGTHFLANVSPGP